MSAQRYANALLDIFEGMSTSQLKPLLFVGDYPKPAIRPRRPRGRHGKVTVRWATPEPQPEQTAPLSLMERDHDINWAWGREDAPRPRFARKHRHQDN